MEHLNLKQSFHYITAAFRMHLVKSAEASPHAKFYSLSTEYSDRFFTKTVYMNEYDA